MSDECDEDVEEHRVDLTIPCSSFISSGVGSSENGSSGAVSSFLSSGVVSSGSSGVGSTGSSQSSGSSVVSSLEKFSPVGLCMDAITTVQRFIVLKQKEFLNVLFQTLEELKASRERFPKMFCPPPLHDDDVSLISHFVPLHLPLHEEKRSFFHYFNNRQKKHFIEATIIIVDKNDGAQGNGVDFEYGTLSFLSREQQERLDGYMNWFLIWGSVSKELWAELSPSLLTSLNSLIDSTFDVHFTDLSLFKEKNDITFSFGDSVDIKLSFRSSTCKDMKAMLFSTSYGNQSVSPRINTTPLTKHLGLLKHTILECKGRESESNVEDFEKMPLATRNLTLLQEDYMRNSIRIPHEFSGENNERVSIKGSDNITDKTNDGTHMTISIIRAFLTFYESFAILLQDIGIVNPIFQRKYVLEMSKLGFLKLENFFKVKKGSNLFDTVSQQFEKKQARNTSEAKNFQLFFSKNTIVSMFQWIKENLCDFSILKKETTEKKILKISEEVFLIAAKNAKKICKDMKDSSPSDCTKAEMEQICFSFDIFYIFIAHVLQISRKHCNYAIVSSCTLAIDLFFSGSIGRNNMSTQELLNKLIKLLQQNHSTHMKENFGIFDLSFKAKHYEEGEVKETKLHLNAKTSNALSMLMGISVRTCSLVLEDEVLNPPKIEVKHSPHSFPGVWHKDVVSSMALVEKSKFSNEKLLHFYENMQNFLKLIFQSRYQQVTTISWERPFTSTMLNSFKPHQINFIRSIVEEKEKAFQSKKRLIVRRNVSQVLHMLFL